VIAELVPFLNCGDPDESENHAERPAVIVGAVPFFVMK
jgi:hypothetical protein